MAKEPDYLVYLGTLLTCVPPGREARETLKRICMKHDITLKHITNSSDDVLTKEREIEKARTSFIATLHTLCDTEHGDEQQLQQLQHEGTAQAATAQEQPAQEEQSDG
jgi:hypothetical protein